MQNIILHLMLILLSVGASEQDGVGGRNVHRPALGCACVMIPDKSRSKPSDEECRKKGDVAAVYNGSEVDRKAVILERPQPDLSSLDHASGRVILKVVFCPHGSVGRVGIVAGVSDQINERAIKAARQIKFEPAMKDGQRVAQYVQLEYEFDIP